MGSVELPTLLLLAKIAVAILSLLVQAGDMKIVSKSELRKMPPGTLYAEYEKGRDWPQGPENIFLGDIDYGISDFYMTGLGCPESSGSDEMFDRQHEMEETGAEYPIDLACDREGLYDDTTRYIVWDEADIRAIACRTSWFDSGQGEWHGTTRYRVMKADGSLRFWTDEEADARQMARPGDTIERMYEQHMSEWRQV